MAVRLTAIHRYPIKSTKGDSVRSAVLEPWGLRGDRRWMLVDPAGECATARQYPRLLQVTATGRAAGITADHPDADTLTVPFPDGPAEPVTVHHKRATAVDAGAAAHAWFSAVTGVPVRLMYQAQPLDRPVNPVYGQVDDRVSLADGYPLLLATTASLDAVNTWIADGPLPAEGPIDMRRFRPNLVVDGSTAWAEDGWRRIRIGAARFRVVKGCDRCVLTATDPDTGTRGCEPLTTLALNRRWDGKVWFAVNLIPDTPGVTLTVGDEVEILDAVADPDGPPR